jgi:uncharacterized membrane protein HdeD (DUF308 family)
MADTSMLQKIKAHTHEVKFWITLLRGIFAILLGLALILQPEKVRPILANFMGMFWMLSGIISLRWGAVGERSRPLARLAGAIGILAGIVMLGRKMIGIVISEAILISLLGIVILLTGLLHAIGGFRTDEDVRQWSWSSFTLGVIEIILGVLLILSPLELGQFVYWAVSIWAFVGGAIIIAEALYLRRQALIHRGEGLPPV